MQIPFFLAKSLSVVWTLKYPLLFIGAFAEGPLLMITSGFLIHQGLLPFFPVFIILILGDLFGDMLWYGIGAYLLEPLLRRKGTFMGITEERLVKIKKLFDTYHEKILIYSKLTLGFGLAVGVLMVAGVTRVPFKKYMVINFLGELFLVAVLMTLGYFFGDTYSKIQTDYQLQFLILLIFVILVVIYGAMRFVKKAFLLL